MKSKKALLAIVLMLSLCGCHNNIDKSAVSTDADNLIDTIIADSNSIESSAFYPKLLKEINSFIEWTGSRLIIVQFENKGDKQFVNLLTYLYYDSRLLCGYEVIDSCMVSYYYSYADGIDVYNFLSMLETREPSEILKESDCAKLLIDKSKLKTDLPNSFPEDPAGYPDENSWFALNCTFESWGRRLLIHSADSLELVFDGPY